MLAEYYDKIYVNKDYEYEVESILEILGQFPKRVLDIGTGTGNHAFAYAKRGAKVTGIDIDRDMIRMAKHKASTVSNPPSFSWSDVSQVFGSFDLLISLFNVVNYIQELSELLVFFQSCRRLLAEGGTLVFDCWNGIAAFLDPPRAEKREYDDLIVNVFPHIDLMDQSVTMMNRVEIAGRNFDYVYHSRLWTPWCLSSALEIAGFDQVKVSAWMLPDVPATLKSWKIMFVCQ